MKNRKRETRPTLECLEPRELLSWTPATIPHQIPAPRGGIAMASNIIYGSGSTIPNNKQFISWTFIAPRSGTYTMKIDAAANSPLFPIMALYGPNGREIGYYTNYTQHLACTFKNLTKGSRYVLGISNITGTPNGTFNMSITGPSFYKGLYNNQGNGISSQGDASIVGNTLTAHLYGWNRSNFYYADHKLQIYLVDSRGRAIHSGCWSLSGRTYGLYISGPGSLSLTHSWDISGFNLTNLADIRLTLL